MKPCVHRGYGLEIIFPASADAGAFVTDFALRISGKENPDDGTIIWVHWGSGAVAMVNDHTSEPMDLLIEEHVGCPIHVG